MENSFDYQKGAVLYVDDEEMSLKYFTRAFENKFRILCAADAAEGYRLLQQYRDEIGLLITDQRMPGEKGVQFLERARQLHPQAVRILTTAYSDVEVAIEAVNSGAIYKYVTKPWDIPQLEVTLKRALEFFMMQRERDFLHMPEKLMTLEEVAEYLNVDRFTVYRLLSQKELPAFKVGNQWRFKRKMLEAWLAKNSNVGNKTSH
jgi:two-component system probable response regulator PhcQ